MNKLAISIKAIAIILILGSVALITVSHPIIISIDPDNFIFSLIFTLILLIICIMPALVGVLLLLKKYRRAVEFFTTGAALFVFFYAFSLPEKFGLYDIGEELVKENSLWSLIFLPLSILILITPFILCSMTNKYLLKVYDNLYNKYAQQQDGTRRC